MRVRILLSTDHPNSSLFSLYRSLPAPALTHHCTVMLFFLVETMSSSMELTDPDITSSPPSAYALVALVAAAANALAAATCTTHHCTVMLFFLVETMPSSMELTDPDTTSSPPPPSADALVAATANALVAATCTTHHCTVMLFFLVDDALFDGAHRPLTPLPLLLLTLLMLLLLLLLLLLMLSLLLHVQLTTAQSCCSSLSIRCPLRWSSRNLTLSSSPLFREQKEKERERDREKRERQREKERGRGRERERESQEQKTVRRKAHRGGERKEVRNESQTQTQREMGRDTHTHQSKRRQRSTEHEECTSQHGVGVAKLFDRAHVHLKVSEKQHVRRLQSEGWLAIAALQIIRLVAEQVFLSLSQHAQHSATCNTAKHPCTHSNDTPMAAALRMATGWKHLLLCLRAQHAAHMKT
jgi:hypothetical protein